MREYRKVPTGRITERLRLAGYARRALRRDVETAPDLVEIPLAQHIGAAAEPVVRPGDGVKAGDLIGDIPSGQLGAAVHASIEGEVTVVDEGRIIIKKI
jgi:Na+-translocating ferredoxin:NAD+ oxidoreductase RnfC subunit